MPTIPAKTFLLKLPADGETALYEVDLTHQTVAPAPEGTAFPPEVVLGATEGDKGRFSLDLSKLAVTMSHWVQSNRAQLKAMRIDRGRLPSRLSDESSWREAVTARLASSAAQIGPDDVVFPLVDVRPDGTRDMQVWAVRMCAESDDSSGKVTTLEPIALKEVTYGPAVNVIRDELNAGTLLAYLPQVAIPVGVTCYLVNLLALEGLDPATLKPI
jgi:hypothetical protein